VGALASEVAGEECIQKSYGVKLPAAAVQGVTVGQASLPLVVQKGRAIGSGSQAGHGNASKQTTPWKATAAP